MWASAANFTIFHSFSPYQCLLCSLGRFIASSEYQINIRSSPNEKLGPSRTKKQGPCLLLGGVFQTCTRCGAAQDDVKSALFCARVQVPCPDSITSFKQMTTRGVSPHFNDRIQRLERERRQGGKDG